MRRPNTRAELEVLKLQRFRALVRHANARAPYYANLIRERGIEIQLIVDARAVVLPAH